MKTTIRVSLLLIAVFCTVMLVRAQVATPMSTTGARPYRGTSAPLLDRGSVVRAVWTSEKTDPWRVHLALQLVKHPRLNEPQVRIILDAISLSGSEFQKAKADDALQALRRRALGVFPKHEVVDLFAKKAVGKAEHDILRSYYDMSALPLKERKISFRNASANDKSELWRTHLALFLVRRPELDEWQKEIILAAISLATPEHFNVRPGSPAWKATVAVTLRSLEEQIVAAFSFEDGAKIFATLGDDIAAANRTPSASGSVLPNIINFEQFTDSGPYMQQTHSQSGQYDKFAGRRPCECSTSSDWCPISGYCSGANCIPTQSGCGTLWSYPCDGVCQ